jgi:hypothetical protein
MWDVPVKSARRTESARRPAATSVGRGCGAHRQSSLDPASRRVNEKLATTATRGRDSMLRWLGGLFLVFHGLIHVAIWVPRLPKGRAVRRASFTVFRRGPRGGGRPRCAGGGRVRRIRHRLPRWSGLVGAGVVGSRCRVDRPGHPHLHAVVVAGVGDRRGHCGGRVAGNSKLGGGEPVDGYSGRGRKAYDCLPTP